MEGVATFSHQQSTIVAWKLAGRAGSVKLHTADATDFILWHIPSPCRDGVPRLYLDFHNCQLLPNACNDTEARHSSRIGRESWSKESCDDETRNRNVAEFLLSALRAQLPPSAA